MVHVCGHHDLSLPHALFAVRMLCNEAVSQFPPPIRVASGICSAGSIQAPLLPNFGRFRLSLSVSLGALFFVGIAKALASSDRPSAAGICADLEKGHENSPKKPKSSYSVFCDEVLQNTFIWMKQMIPIKDLHIPEELIKNFQPLVASPAFQTIQSLFASPAFQNLSQTIKQLEELQRLSGSLKNASLVVADPRKMDSLCTQLECVFYRVNSILAPFSDIKLDYEKLKIFQTIADIELDLSPYADTPLNDIINALKGHKPCDYKEVLRSKFPQKQKASTTSIQYLEIIKIIIYALGVIIKFLMYLDASGAKLNDEEFKLLMEEGLIPYIDQRIEEEIQKQQSPKAPEPKCPVLITCQENAPADSNKKA